MIKLLPHHMNPTSDRSVYVDYHKNANNIVIEFNVVANELSTNKNFSLGPWDNQGLWDFDVVEVFLQGQSDDGAYLELQCSPLGQKFALLVKEPRKSTQQVTKLNSIVDVIEQEADGFKVKFTVDASDIPGAFTHLKGNFFCCLGPAGQREYFALNINKEDTADFHRPDLFVSLESK